MTFITFPALRLKSAADFGRVAVLYGGPSSERAVSLESGRNVLEALQRQGITVEGIDGVDALLVALMEKRIDRVFNIMHGGAGENGTVQGLLRAVGVPFTGSDVAGAALTLDKVRTKQVWLSAGLPTPKYVRLQPRQDVNAAAQEIGLPLIIKPSLEGSSVGVSRIFEQSQIADALLLAQKYGGELLMESLIQGGEYTVGILGEIALPSIHIVPAGEYYDYHAKYVAEDTQYICPGLAGDAEVAMRALALAAFRSSGASGWGRVDLMRDTASCNWLLEVNTTPGMTSHSLVPKAAAAAGIGFDELVWRILETSLPNHGAATS
jgi:D-alanine-D-alanine ligase